EPALESLQLTLQKSLGAARVGLTPREVALHHSLEVVDVAQVHSVEAAHGRVDVAWHRDVDQQQRTAAARDHHRVELVPLDDAVGRPGRRQDYVGPFQLG